MSEVSKYTVPEEGLKATVEAMKNPSGTKFLSTEQCASLGLEAFIRWQSENLIVPSHEQVIHLCEIFANRSVISYCDSVRAVAIEWLRIMYLAPEPEVPEEIKDLLLTEQSHKDVQPLKGELNSLIMEAYRRGKASK